MPKRRGIMNDQEFELWEEEAFGFGYGSGEVRS
jgi:hypothetical protein